ncbi:MAG: VOC family protein, partial [Deltaproteobacteria bacterium]|nr:VOC family protein [Deltaproteobacteria bacterium]
MPKPHHPRRAFRSLVIFAVVTTACPTSSPDTSGHASKPSPPSSPTTAKIPSPPPPKAPPRDPISHDNPSLLGGERGLDHLGIVVDDLPVARKAFTKLGFSNPQAGRLPNGIQNTNFYFGDSTYLELLTPYDAQKAPGVAAFLAKHRCGAMFFVLATKSYPKTAAFLRHAGFPVGRPFPGHIQAKGLSGKRTMWHTFFFADPKPFANDPFFFITYRPSLRAYLLRRLADPKVRQTSFAHKNGA